MTESNFRGSLIKAKKILKKYELSKEDGMKLIYKDGVSKAFKKASLSEDYFALYNVAAQNFDFDILMNDDSIFQFNFKIGSRTKVPHIRFAFYQTPYLYQSFEEYIKYLIENEIYDPEDVIGLEDFYLEEYEQFLQEQQLNTSNTSIRFDVDALNHIPKVHSTAHFHIGHYTQIRIPCDKIISPLGFVIFVLRHVYFKDWKDRLIKDIEFLELIKNQKNEFFKIKDIDHNKWLIEEEQDLFIE